MTKALKGEWRVIDANTLRRPPLLTHFLKESTTNIAVITDFCCMECYKGDSLRALQKSLTILSRHPHQVVVLKGTQDITRITAKPLVDREDFVDWDQTLGFSVFCTRVSKAAAGDAQLTAQIHALGSEANAFLDKLAREALTLGGAISQVSESLPPALRSRLRSKTSLTQDDILLIIEGVVALAKEMFGRHPEMVASSFKRIPFGSFVFRFSLAAYLLAISWVAMGGVENVAPNRWGNDVVDMNYVAFATYFDGVLSNDKRVNEIYESAMLFLNNAFLDVDD